MVLPCRGQDLEVATGIWGTGDQKGFVFIANCDEYDIALESGSMVGIVTSGEAVVQQCMECGLNDAEWWPKWQREEKKSAMICTGCQKQCEFVLKANEDDFDLEADLSGFKPCETDDEEILTGEQVADSCGDPPRGTAPEQAVTGGRGVFNI